MTGAEVTLAVLADLNAQLDQAYLALAGTVLDAQAYDDLAKRADELEVDRDQQRRAADHYLADSTFAAKTIATLRAERDEARGSADYWHSRFIAAAQEAAAADARLARASNPP